MVYIKRLVMHGFKSFVKKTEIPFTEEINVVLGPNGSGKCVTGDSKVVMGDGSLRRIDDLVNSRLHNSVKTEDGYLIPEDGTEVKCMNLDTLKIESRKIKSFVKRTSPENLLTIKTRSGKKITATEYHPLFTLKDGQVKEARADELKEGVRIAVPRQVHFNPEHKYFTELLNEITEEDRIYVPFREEYKLILNSMKDNLTWENLSKNIGVSYYTLKGLLDGQSINLHSVIKILRFAKLTDLEIINLIKEFISHGKITNFDFKNSPEFSRFLGYILAEGRLTPSNQIWFTNGTSEIMEDYVYLVKKLFNKNPLIREYKQNCWDIIFYSAPLIRILNKLGVKENSGTKEISNTYMMHSSNEEISELLNGLYSGDGYVSHSSIEITTKSEKLAEGIEFCLLRLGMFPSKRKITKTIKSINFSGEYHNVVLYGTNNFNKFGNNIHLVHPLKNSKIILGSNKKRNPNLDIIEANNLVKSITKELGINVKVTKKQFPSLDSYCYNQCLPSRNGLQNLCNNLFFNKTKLVNQLEVLSNSDIFWDEIIEINGESGEDWVYDLCVENHHNFIANNIVVHNSNISDAICFVLGRLSVKSMRAAKAKNLIFMGSKIASPAKEASVEMVFDNSDSGFSVDNKEVSIKRIVRRNGQSIYKIDNQTKTRQEVLALLAQAGIDPNGFNIILQGEIQNLVRMHTEERRKIIEEVSGISIYESRKAKALRELEKTEEKLKEIGAILRERTNYLNNLEKERQQALRFKKLEQDSRDLKASIISSDIYTSKKQLDSIISSIEKETKKLNETKKKIISLESDISSYETKIVSINSTIQQSTGLEQEKLNQEITNIRAELAGLSVNIENYSEKISKLENSKKEVLNLIEENEKSIKQLDVSSSSAGKEIYKKKEIELKKAELERLEEERKKFYMVKSELKSIRERINEKQSSLQNYGNESDFLLKQISSLSRELFDKKTNENNVKELRNSLLNNKQLLEDIRKREVELEKIAYRNEYEIDKQNKLIEDISKIDVCPVCKSKITEDHVHSIRNDALPEINSLQKQIENSDKELGEIYNKKKILEQNIERISLEISNRESDLIKLSNIKEKEGQIKSVNSKIEITKSEIKQLDKRKKFLEEKHDDNSNVEQKYETARVELEEISLRNNENLDSEISFKKRELERAKISLKQMKREEEELNEDLKSAQNIQNKKEEELKQKRKAEEELSKKFQSLIETRDNYQKEIRNREISISTERNSVYNIEQEINSHKIEKARIDATLENLNTELLSFSNVNIIKTSKDKLSERLSKVQELLLRIGNVNMRSLEVYDSVKKEYDSIKEKTDTIAKEKEGILKIVHEIDIKKKKTFLKTLSELNETFSRNFTSVSAKGQVSLELENKKEPFDGGVNVIVKTGHGKYFDVTSLSGGEQTLVALSLIFAIQELNPYCFYVLDEIDAALDKRNSERLAGLLKKYMKQGQYIVITHNDEVISNANCLYGVSMHEGVSKITSLKL